MQIGFPDGSDNKESACNAGDLGLIPGSGRSPGEENGNPLRYSCLENSIERGAWWTTVHGVKKSWTQLNSEHFKNKYSLWNHPEEFPDFILTDFSLLVRIIHVWIGLIWLRYILLKCIWHRLFSYHDCDSHNLLRQAWNYRRAIANLAFKMNITLPLAETWMCLEMTVLSKVSQKEKDKYHMMSLNGV